MVSALSHEREHFSCHSLGHPHFCFNSLSVLCRSVPSPLHQVCPQLCEHWATPTVGGMSHLFENCVAVGDGRHPKTLLRGVERLAGHRGKFIFGKRTELILPLQQTPVATDNKNEYGPQSCRKSVLAKIPPRSQLQ